IPAGIVSAVRRNTMLDYISTVVALLGQSMPTFWLGIMLILVFSVQFNLLPSSGRGGFEHLILPAITLGLFTTARITRLTRSGMLEVLSQDYIRTARAKGMGGPPVVWKHGLKNAAMTLPGRRSRVEGAAEGGAEPGRAGGRAATGAAGLGPGGDGGKEREPGRAWGRPPTESSDLGAPATMTATTIAIPAGEVAARSEWLTVLRRLARRRTALFGLVVVALVFAAAVGAPWLSPWDPIEQDITNRLKPPGSPDPSGRVHVLGTDHLGRDLLARVTFGAR